MSRQWWRPQHLQPSAACSDGVAPRSDGRSRPRRIIAVDTAAFGIDLTSTFETTDISRGTASRSD